MLFLVSRSSWRVFGVALQRKTHHQTFALAKMVCAGQGWSRTGQWTTIDARSSSAMSSGCPLECVMGWCLSGGKTHERYSTCCILYGNSASRQSVNVLGLQWLWSSWSPGGGSCNHEPGRLCEHFEHLPASAQDIFHQPQSIFVFHDDNAPHHTGKRAVAWISNQPFHQMQWPPYSPDKNIIETAWGWLMKKLNVDPLETLQQLKQRVHQHWNEIIPHALRRLYHQMAHHIGRLRRMFGYPTKY